MLPSRISSRCRCCNRTPTSRPRLPGRRLGKKAWGNICRARARGLLYRIASSEPRKIFSLGRRASERTSARGRTCARPTTPSLDDEEDGTWKPSVVASRRPVRLGVKITRTSRTHPLRALGPPARLASAKKKKKKSSTRAEKYDESRAGWPRSERCPSEFQSTRYCVSACTVRARASFTSLSFFN